MVSCSGTGIQALSVNYIQGILKYLVRRYRSCRIKILVSPDL
jgi:hypothetical protein